MNRIFAKNDNVSPEEDFNTEAMAQDIMQTINGMFPFCQITWSRDQVIKAYELALEQQKLDALRTLVKSVQSIDDTLIRM